MIRPRITRAVVEPGGDGQGDDHRPEIDRSEDRERDDGERQVGQAVQRVEEPHHAVVDPAAEEARDRAVDDPDAHDGDRRREPDADGDAATKCRADEEVAAELVCSEQMLPARRFEGFRKSMAFGS